MSFNDMEMNKMAEGSKSKGIDAEEAAAAGPKSDAGESPTTMAKSSESLKILGAGKPHGCTTKAMY